MTKGTIKELILLAVVILQIFVGGIRAQMALESMETLFNWAYSQHPCNYPSYSKSDIPGSTIDAQFKCKNLLTFLTLKLLIKFLS